VPTRHGQAAICYLLVLIEKICGMGKAERISLLLFMMLKS